MADFREFVGTHTDDPRFVRLVDELSQSSERFRQLWARHDVNTPGGMPMLHRHPRVRDLTLSRENLVIGGAEDQMGVVCHAEPGTSSAERMALLASLANPGHE